MYASISPSCMSHTRCPSTPSSRMACNTTRNGSRITGRPAPAACCSLPLRRAWERAPLPMVPLLLPRNPCSTPGRLTMVGALRRRLEYSRPGDHHPTSSRARHSHARACEWMSPARCRSSAAPDSLSWRAVSAAVGCPTACSHATTDSVVHSSTGA